MDKTNRLTIEMPFVVESARKPLVEVHRTSPKKHRAAVETVARYFKREFQYDSLQYSAENDDAIAFLFIDPDTMRVDQRERWHLLARGAICFRQRPLPDHEIVTWRLDWVWLHPYFRNAGVLDRHFDLFEKRFGDFFIGAPLSNSMKRFLEKRNFPVQDRLVFR